MRNSGMPSSGAAVPVPVSTQYLPTHTLIAKTASSDSDSRPARRRTNAAMFLSAAAALHCLPPPPSESGRAGDTKGNRARAFAAAAPVLRT